MAIAVQMDYRVDLCKPVHLIQMDVPFFKGDKNAHRFHVKLERNGCAIDVGDITATGYMVRADKQTVIWDAQVDGCDIYLTMPASCYAVVGRFRLLLRVSSGETVETALWVEGSIRESATDIIVDPDNVLPNLEELLAQIDEMQSVTAEAKETLAAINAETSASSIIATVSGAPVTVTDTAAKPFKALNVYGRTDVEGTPEPNAPATLVSVAEDGTLTLLITGSDGITSTDGGSVTVAVERGLCAIPVTSGGNYTDAFGQSWWADEIDLARGVIIRRVGVVELDGVTNCRMASSRSANTRVMTYVVKTDDWGRVIGKGVMLLVSHYPYMGTASGGSALTRTGVMICDVPGSMYIGHDGIDTVGDYNTWLAAQYAAGTPVTVMYQLAEPIEEPLDGDTVADAAKLRCLYPVTTVKADGAWITAQYFADTKNYIDKKLAELSEAVRSTGAHV